MLDFPPLLAAVDAHALWHVSTAPIAHLLWRSFVEPELRWCVAHASDAAPGTDSGNDPLPVTRGLRRLGGGRS